MAVLVGTVVDGKIEIPPESFAEGAQVVISPPEFAPVELSEDDEEDLFQAMEEIRRGEFVDGDQLLAELRARAAR